MVSRPDRPPRLVAWLVVLATTVATCVVGGCTGVMVSNGVYLPGRPAAVPSPPAQFPHAGQRYLSVTVEDAEEVLTGQGHECRRRGDTGLSGAAHAAVCRPPAGRIRAVVQIEYDAPAQVRQLWASCRSQDAAAAGCRRLLSLTAAAALAGHPEAARARRWVQQHHGGVAVRVLAGVELVLQPGELTARPRA